mmetsp:Transcript_4680/g.18699  ORF Transcript_4680/g.18699 Transcript_4680/m.18699 type:complete len:239 (+) Transcript_4680:2469-3185(+)|eukprot:scaffold576_cov260-Pinguiococcus_pyrenoidosus.AAC.117
MTHDDDAGPRLIIGIGRIGLGGSGRSTRPRGRALAQSASRLRFVLGDGREDTRSDSVHALDSRVRVRRVFQVPRPDLVVVWQGRPVQLPEVPLAESSVKLNAQRHVGSQWPTAEGALPSPCLALLIYRVCCKGGVLEIQDVHHCLAQLLCRLPCAGEVGGHDPDSAPRGQEVAPHQVQKRRGSSPGLNPSIGREPVPCSANLRPKGVNRRIAICEGALAVAYLRIRGDDTWAPTLQIW